MKKQLSYFLIGLFVILMGIGLIFITSYLSGESTKADRYFIYYNQVAGVSSGAPVTYNGFKIGQIDTVEAQIKQSKVRYKIFINVRTDWPIPEDSIATIYSSGLLSTISIDIQGGKSEQLLAQNSEIKGKEKQDIFATMNKMAGSADDILEQGFKPLLDNINQQIEDLMYPLKKGTDVLVSDLTQSSQMLKTSMTQINQSLPALLKSLIQITQSLEAILSKKNKQHFNQFMQKMDQNALIMKKIMLNLTQSTQKLNQILANSQTILNENKPNLKETSQNLKQSSLLFNKKLARILFQLNNASRDLAEFSHQVRQNPSSLLSSRPNNERGLK